MPLLLPSMPKTLALALLGFALLSCDQDLNSSQDQPTVDYVVLATDSATSVPLDSVRIRVTTISGDTSSYFTSEVDGRAQIPTVASSRTLFELSRAGYTTRDTIDTVNAKPDTVFHRPIPRLLTIRLRKVGETGIGRIQVAVFPRDPNLNKITQATAIYEDSMGERRIAADTGGLGSIGLTGLLAGKTQVLVKRPGYLGHWFEATVNSVSDTGRPVPLVTVLAPLGAHSISGRVFYATGSSNKPLAGARVEFRLKDSLAVPDTFFTFTSGDSLHPGRFELDSVPALDGQMLYFKDRNSTEPVKTVPILASEVQADGPLSPVTLTIPSDSSLPYLTKAPGDSAQPNDTLAFLFNQRVDVLEQFKVELVNQGELLSDTGWNVDHTRLRLWLKGSKWTRGKTYQYRFSARNGAGQYFSLLGDTARVLTGRFSIPDSIGSDSVLLPARIAFSLFNSGADYRFGEGDSASSPFADSSSEFARLRWGWSGTSGRKADSLVLWYMDDDRNPGWTRWGSVSGPLDSATLALSDHYSTTRSSNAKNPPLPFKNGGHLWFMVVPKYQGKNYPEIYLDPLAQGMGPSVYSIFENGSNPLKVGAGGKDSVRVQFRKAPDNASTIMDWDADRPEPTVYYNGKVDTSLARWHWNDSRHGRVEFTLPNPLTAEPRIRVDLGQTQYLGKPIWHRNGGTEFTLRP